MSCCQILYSVEKGKICSSLINFELAFLNENVTLREHDLG